MKKTVTINGVDRTFGTVTVNIAEQLQLATKSGLQFNKALVLASLKAGGDDAVTAEDIGELGYFSGSDNSFNAYIAPTLEVNGLKTEGEKAPAEPATATAAA